MPSVMSNSKFLVEVQKFTAIQAVSASTVRGQRKGKDPLRKIHEYLGHLRLDRLAGMDCTGYARWLDAHTRHLQKKLGGRTEQWGVARKAMNLFMRSCLYNTYLSKKFRLRGVQQHMEIPLDNKVARGLKKYAGRGKLPPWPGLTELGPEESQQFQDDAKKCALDVGLRDRVFLDNYLWLKYR